MTAATKTAAPMKFRLPHTTAWEECKDASDAGGSDSSAAAARDRLSSFLMSSLQMQHLLVLAGSGTSYEVGGPKMPELWTECVGPSPSTEIKGILKLLGYGLSKGEDNIEELLSRCDALLSFNKEATVERFRDDTITKILARCRMPGTKPEHDLGMHREFLRRLARRRARDTRLRLFTTNYDLCFERAAGDMSLVAIDGFSFAHPRRFDPRYFEYDIVHRGSGSTDNSHSFVAGVFQYFKLHGSVDWESTDTDGTVINPAVKASRACLTYPARAKYQRSFQQPHLELMAQYLASLRQANTCLMVTGFGFNDAHLTEPILSALQSNPHFRLVIVARSAATKLDDPKGDPFWSRLSELFKAGVDVALLAGTFEQLVRLTPDLQALSPAERLHGAIRDVARK